MKQYPARLYPKKEFAIISKPELEHILCRYTDPDIKLKGDDDKINAEAIDLKRIPGLSTNKVPDSEVEDCYIQIKSDHKPKYLIEWNQGDEPVLVENEHFELVDNRGYFLLKINDIHGFVDEYPFPADASKKEFKFQVFVKHTPLVSNYFHFELEVIDKDGNSVKNGKGAWRKIIFQSIQDKLIKVVKFSLNDFEVSM